MPWRTSTGSSVGFGPLEQAHSSCVTTGRLKRANKIEKIEVTTRDYKIVLLILRVRYKLRNIYVYRLCMIGR